MKLSQIYSDQKFKKVVFNEGFNIVIGKVTKPKDTTVDSHNLGKSTLISVIDFLLLKELDPAHFLNKYKSKFNDYTFFLEVQLNSERYLTIRRSVESNTKISMLLHDSRNENHIKTIEWTYSNVPIRKAKETLNLLLGFDVLKEYSYRKTLSYFLRTQDDYQDVFQLKKNMSSEHSDWKPVLFDMLGFSGELLVQKYELDDRKASIKGEIKKLQSKSIADSEEIDKLRGLIQVREEEQANIKSKLDNFDFYEQELKLNNHLLEETESEISKLNSARYGLEFELEKINESLKTKIDFDLKEIESLYKEVDILFADSLKKTYEEVIEFNKQLFSERNKHLKLRQTDVKNNLRIIEKDLIKLNEEQAQILSVLQDDKAINKYKHYQSQIVETESEILLLKNELKKLNEIDLLTEKSTKVDTQTETLKEQIKKQVNEAENESYTSIRSTFNHIVKEIINLPAIPSIKINKNGNVEFEADIQDVTQTEITAKGKGTTYRKLLCVAFDLSILITYSSKSFFKFVYHDGALEGLDNRKKINFLKVVKDICTKYDIQYILTSIEDDLPRNDDGKVISFKPSEVALELDDKGDNGRLFETSF